MPKENVKKFFKKLDTDPQFKKQFESAKNKEEAIEILKENGLLFTHDEYIEMFPVYHGRDLTEQELAQIARGYDPAIHLGGYCCFT